VAVEALVVLEEDAAVKVGGDARCGRFVVVPKSKESQSPSQKSKWRFSGAEQGAGLEVDRDGG
jgi:hypothetical protein